MKVKKKLFAGRDAADSEQVNPVGTGGHTTLWSIPLSKFPGVTIPLTLFSFSQTKLGSQVSGSQGN